MGTEKQDKRLNNGSVALGFQRKLSLSWKVEVLPRFSSNPSQEGDLAVPGTVRCLEHGQWFSPKALVPPLGLLVLHAARGRSAPERLCLALQKAGPF